MLGLLLAGACQAPSDELARSQWLHQTLILDTQVFLEREPEQAAGKLAKMGEKIYPFFRGTAAQYARDVMQPGSPGYWPSAYETAETSDVALVGDPHPENLGTFARAADGEISVEFNDFDAATFGPYGFDLRRLALGYWIATEQIRRQQAELEVTDPSRMLGEEHRLATARVVVRGYAEEIAGVAANPRQGAPMLADAAGAVLAELVERAADDGVAREELADYTRMDDDDQRGMFLGDVEARRLLVYGEHAQRVYEDTLVPLDERQAAHLRALLDGWAASLEGDTARAGATWRLQASARRLGAGVASYPVLRYYALLEGPTDSLDDDVLLEVKQVLDAVPMPGLPRFPGQPFYTNAERVAQMQRRLQSTPDADPWLGWVSLGADGYRVRWRTGYQRTLRVDRVGEALAAGEHTIDDFLALAETSGRLLARRHGIAPKLDGRPGAPAIARAIDGDDEGLVEEVAGFVEAYAPQVLADHRAFVELLETHGMDLGYARR